MSIPRQDVFPAFVVITHPGEPTPLTELSSAPMFPKTGYQVNTSRVVMFGDTITIAVDGSDGPRVVFREKVDITTFIKGATVREDSFVQTISGKKIAYKKDTACGCGSRLKSWNPYKSLYSSKDPTE